LFFGLRQGAAQAAQGALQTGRDVSIAMCIGGTTVESVLGAECPRLVASFASAFVVSLLEPSIAEDSACIPKSCPAHCGAATRSRDRGILRPFPWKLGAESVRDACRKQSRPCCACASRKGALDLGMVASTATAPSQMRGLSSQAPSSGIWPPASKGEGLQAPMETSLVCVCIPCNPRCPDSRPWPRIRPSRETSPGAQAGPQVLPCVALEQLPIPASHIRKVVHCSAAESKGTRSPEVVGGLSVGALAQVGPLPSTR